MTDNIISLSGGKDSCAVGLLMHHLKIPITAMVAVVTPWEFDVIDDVFKRMEDITGVPVTKLYPKPFNWWMTKNPVVGKDKTFMGFGNGWPSRENGRWCTREKFRVFDRYVDHMYPNHTRCIGYAADEVHRTETKSMAALKNRGIGLRYPLIEVGATEEDALQLCYASGIKWGGIYEVFRTGTRTPRLSCFCCPHQPVDALRVLRREFPEKWAWMLEEGAKMWRPVFKNGKTIQEWENLFSREGAA